MYRKIVISSRGFDDRVLDSLFGRRVVFEREAGNIFKNEVGSIFENEVGNIFENEVGSIFENEVGKNEVGIFESGDEFLSEKAKMEKVLDKLGRRIVVKEVVEEKKKKKKKRMEKINGVGKHTAAKDVAEEEARVKDIAEEETRAEVMKKLFPKISVGTAGIPVICPRDLDSEWECWINKFAIDEDNISECCQKCQRTFWLKKNK